MKLFYIRCLFVTILFSLFFKTYAQETAKIKFPIEVMGSGIVTKKITFPISNASEIKKLFLKIHRPGYRDFLDIGDDRAKMSIKINNGNWIDIINANVNVYETEKNYGGISGGYHTIRLTLNTDQFIKGDNIIRFRFNGTDGFSSGFRVVNMNLKRGDFSNLWNSSNRIDDDPTLWIAPLNNSTDINKGRDLWYTKNLRENPLSNRILNAKCTSCHAQDGRDLKYFNYSNYSIIERSKFHGLTEKEGKQIASYIRSLNTPAPKQARPYNPPYQPGPDLDNKPVEHWAAGAGLVWVLDKDEEMKEYLFPYGTSQNGLEKVIDHKATLNIRTMPIALQFPDWNSWLPATHPIDIWDKNFYETSKAFTFYKDTREQLESIGVDQLIVQNQLQNTLDKIEEGVKVFLNRNSTNTKGKWRVSDGDAAENINNGYSFEEAKLQLAKIVALRSWEVVQEFKIEDRAPDVYGSNGEIRSWPFASRSVFNVAPHIVADNLNNFPRQEKMLGDFFSTSWYQLQMTINAANRQPRGERPVDWPYQQKHVRDLGEYEGTPLHPLRFIATEIKAYEARVNAKGSNRSGFELRITHPWWYYSDIRGDTAMLDALDEVEPGLRNAIVEQLLKEFLRIVLYNQDESFKPENWKRVTHDVPSTQRWAGVEPEDYLPVPYDGTSAKFIMYPQNYHADNFYRIIPRFKENGIDQRIINDLADWCKSMWPLGDWEKFKESLINRAPVGKIVALKAKNVQRYLSSGTGEEIYANTTTIEITEKYSVEDAGNGYIALRSLYNDQYIRADITKDRVPFIAAKNTIGDWMKFQWIENQDGSISLKAANNKRLLRCDKTIASNPLFVEGDKIGDWMKFDVDIMTEGTDTFITTTQWHLQNKDSELWIRPQNKRTAINETVPLVLTKASNIGSYTQFKFIPTNDGYYTIQNVATKGRYRAIECSLESGDMIDIVQVSQEYKGNCVRWRLVDAGDGYYRIENKESGFWMRNNACKDDNDDTITITKSPTSNDGNCTKWKLIPSSTMSSYSNAIQIGRSDDFSDNYFYPNPVSDVLYVNNPDIERIIIYNTAGTEVLRIKGVAKEGAIDVSMLQTGMYFISIRSKTSNENYIDKLIIN